MPEPLTDEELFIVRKHFDNISDDDVREWSLRLLAEHRALQATAARRLELLRERQYDDRWTYCELCILNDPGPCCLECNRCKACGCRDDCRLAKELREGDSA